MSREATRTTGTQGTSAEDLGSLRAAVLKKRLRALGVSSAGCVEKRELVDLLRAAQKSGGNAEAAPSSTSASAAAAPAVPSAAEASQAAAQLRSATPGQLRMQAHAMRTNGSALPQCAGQSDEQIRAGADQLDAMANDPALLEKVASEFERRAGVSSPSAPRDAAAAPAFAAANSQRSSGAASKSAPHAAGGSVMAPFIAMSGAELLVFVKAQKKYLDADETYKMHPLFRQIAGQGGQFKTVLDMAVQLGPDQLKLMVSMMLKMQSCCMPILSCHARVNRWTGGHATAVFVALIAFALYSLWRWLFPYSYTHTPVDVTVDAAIPDLDQLGGDDFGSGAWDDGGGDAMGGSAVEEATDLFDDPPPHIDGGGGGVGFDEFDDEFG